MAPLRTFSRIIPKYQTLHQPITAGCPRVTALCPLSTPLSSRRSGQTNSLTHQDQPTVVSQGVERRGTWDRNLSSAHQPLGKASHPRTCTPRVWVATRGTPGGEKVDGDGWWGTGRYPPSPWLDKWCLMACFITQFAVKVPLPV